MEYSWLSDKESKQGGRLVMAQLYFHPEDLKKSANGEDSQFIIASPVKKEGFIRVIAWIDEKGADEIVKMKKDPEYAKQVRERTESKRGNKVMSEKDFEKLDLVETKVITE